MNRATKPVKIGEYEVEIIESLTWGEKEDLQSEILKGAKIGLDGVQSFDASVMREMKYRLMEIAVKSIKKGEESITFTRDWVNNLSIEDGDLLASSIEHLNAKKK